MWGGHKSPITRGIKARACSPRLCIPPTTHLTSAYQCIPLTQLTPPTTSPPPTFSSRSCHRPSPLTVTIHRPRASTTLAKDQIMRVPVSTLARHSAATVAIVEPTPQTVHSTAAAELLGAMLGGHDQ